MIAFITGSNFYDFPDFTRVLRNTRFGEATVLRGESGGREVLVLPRHGAAHRNLPNHINYRANLLALRELGATAIISCSVCGVINGKWPLSAPILADDLFFPENRLPDGSVCTIFVDPGERERGHLLAESFFHAGLNAAIERVWKDLAQPVLRGVYAHANGPRFNSKAEIGGLARSAVDFLSQTCGPEAVLANELELPFALAAFGIDYANGVHLEPTAIETLQANLASAKAVFTHLIENLPRQAPNLSFENFLYRFDS